MTVTTLSELEGSTLGAVWTLGPCTAYAVRVAFRDSPTAGWSASAGAIYPLMKRLEERGLLESRPHVRGKRPSRRYSLTDRGQAALTAWLVPPLGHTALSIPVDPLRARVRFLGALPGPQRARFVERAREALLAQVAELDEIRGEAAAGDDPFWPLAIDGALAVTRARLAWLRDVDRQVGPDDTARRNEP